MIDGFPEIGDRALSSFGGTDHGVAHSADNGFTRSSKQLRRMRVDVEDAMPSRIDDNDPDRQRVDDVMERSLHR